MAIAMDKAAPGGCRGYVQIITDQKREWVEVMSAQRINDMLTLDTRFPKDGIKARSQYTITAGIKAEVLPDMKAHLELSLSELRALRSSMGHVSGKEVRRLICKIKRARKPILCRLPSERVLIELVTQFMHRKNPNKLARMIRRAVARKARAEVQATRPLLAVKPNFAELRSVDGKDLDSAFRGQDES